MCWLIVIAGMLVIVIMVLLTTTKEPDSIETWQNAKRHIEGEIYGHKDGRRKPH